MLLQTFSTIPLYIYTHEVHYTKAEYRARDLKLVKKHGNLTEAADRTRDRILITMRAMAQN